MPAITLANLVLYVLHVAAIAGIGLGVPVMCGLTSPRVRLLHYRLVLVLALVLPLAGTAAAPASPAWLRSTVQAEPRVPAAAVGDGVHGRTVDATETSGPARWVRQAIPEVIAFGFLARLAWVAVGLRSLRRLRREAERLDPRPVPVREAVALASVDADIKVSPEIACPVNFGARRPAVLLPRAVLTYPDAEQRAVTCHELIHVRRQDWLRIVGDEIVRAAFWFHPAVWWLLAEIHLAREQVVDEQVVRITGTRRPYLEALVKLARPAARPALRPAPSFVRRAHLAQRVTLLLKEIRMSKSRVVGAFAASTASVLVTAALAVWALPLQAAPANAPARVGEPVIQAATQPGVANPAPQQKKMRERQPKLLSRATPVYPPEAKEKGLKGVVILEGRLGTSGEVTDVKVLRSIRGLDEAAIDAARQYRFEPQATEQSVVISIAFPPGTGTYAPMVRPLGTARTGGERTPQPKLLSKVEPVYPPEAKAKGIKGVVIVEGRVNTSGEVIDVKVLRSIPALDQAAIDAVKQYRFAPQPTEKGFVVSVRFPR